MGLMRAWLDRSGYAPSRFDCERDGDAMVVSVDFATDREGQAFEAHFGSGPPPTSIPGQLAR